MREIITLQVNKQCEVKDQVGCCGNAIGFNFWNQLCNEHSIDVDGRKKTEKRNDKLIDDFFFREKDEKGLASISY